jgi:hypothetical protein
MLAGLFGVGVLDIGIGIGVANSTYGYVTGQMDFDTAVDSYQKWMFAGISGGLSAASYIFTLAISPWVAIFGTAAFAGGVFIGSEFAGGDDALLSGIWQVVFNRKSKALTLKDSIKSAAQHYHLPSQIVASVLVAELLDYNVYDYLFDDFTIIGPESHSMGLAQFRIDNMRKWNVNGWDKTTPASTIRSSLMDPVKSVWILAQVLRKFYDSASQATKNLCHLEKWDLFDYNDPSDKANMEKAVSYFVGAKDKGFLSPTGLLAGASDKALKYVVNSGAFND